MSEYKSRKNNSYSKGHSPLLRRFGRYCISAIDGKRKFRIPYDLRGNGWRTWTDEYDFALTWYSYRIAITLLSAAAFGIGIGELTLKVMNR